MYYLVLRFFSIVFIYNKINILYNNIKTDMNMNSVERHRMNVDREN